MLPKNVNKGLKVAGEVGLGILLIIRGKSIMFIISAVFKITPHIIHPHQWLSSWRDKNVGRVEMRSTCFLPIRASPAAPPCELGSSWFQWNVFRTMQCFAFCILNRYNLSIHIKYCFHMHSLLFSVQCLHFGCIVEHTLFSVWILALCTFFNPYPVWKASVLLPAKCSAHTSSRGGGGQPNC